MIRRRAAVILAAALAVSLAPAGAVSAADALGEPAATPIAEPPAQPAGDGTGVRLATDKGDIVIYLYTESSPVAAENFLNLVNAGFYDGLTFHRLVPGFVIQGGDPAGDGTGGPGYTIADEPIVGCYGRGIVAMARTPEPHSQGSQFFVVLDDGAKGALESANTYAIFGRVTEGMDVVDEIAAMPTVNGDTAQDPVHITKATVEEVPAPEEPECVPPPAAGAPRLGALLPTEIAGLTTQLNSWNGDEYAAQVSADDPQRQDLEARIAAAGGTLSGLQFATVLAGGGEDGLPFAQVIALHLDGASPDQVLAQVVPLITAFTEQAATPTQVAGRDVLELTDPSGEAQPYKFYAATAGEDLFIVIATEDLAADAVATIPE